MQYQTLCFLNQAAENTIQHLIDNVDKLLDCYITKKKERTEAIKKDPYLNALQVKFAYALTVHKLQGGQWAAVFVDQGYLKEEQIDPEYLRWLYTAITRATHEIFLVNFHERFYPL